MKTLLRHLDNSLNTITMYRLLLYGLIIILAAAIGFSATNVMSLSAIGLTTLVTVLIASCYATNKLLSRLYGVATNNESWLITALILACILPPATTAVRALYVALAGGLAMASKYVLIWRRKHVFNPAAIAAVVMSLLGLVSVTWWIGNPTMLPFTLLLGLLVIRKIGRGRLFLAFAAASVAMLLLVAVVDGQVASVVIKNAFLSGPLIFLGTIMLTEPATMPPTRYYQVLYGLLVGTLYSAQLRFGIFSTSPHMVLAIGNLFAFAISPRSTLRLRLKEKRQISAQVFDYVFTPDRQPVFMPGQYMEWTLRHKHVDGRGNRRTFTIASSPTESDVHLGVKFYKPASSFKRALWHMKPGDSITAGILAGDFTLPATPTQKLVWIAGGIGITPFRSMAKYLLDTQQTRDITLFYLAKPDELAYRDILADARNAGVRTVPVIATRLNIEMLQREVPDFAERTYYVSGPNQMVQTYDQLLRDAGISGKQITTDYFSGY